MNTQKLIGPYTIPTMERAAALYALGFEVKIIAEILEGEFGDYEQYPITEKNIKEFLRRNRTNLKEMRQELTVDCRKEIAQQFQHFFNVTKNTETKMVDVYLEKMNDLLEELKELDLQEEDDLGNKKNTQRLMILMATIERLHGMIAKITGTNALRDVEIHRMKKMIEKEIEESPILPGGKISGSTTIDAEAIPTTQFIE